MGSDIGVPLFRHWPCALKIAHAKHPGCKGVRCHPDTMIGRQDVPVTILKPSGRVEQHFGEDPSEESHA